ncbi:RBM39 protein, partial [Polypterus senegalus]
MTGTAWSQQERQVSGGVEPLRFTLMESFKCSSVSLVLDFDFMTFMSDSQRVADKMADDFDIEAMLEAPYKKDENKPSNANGHEERSKKESIDNLTPEERDARTVFCMQLAARIRPRDLEEFFSAVGKVRDVRMISDRNSRRSKGIAYIEFVEASSVPLAIGLTGQRLLGVPIIVQASQAEKNRAAAMANNLQKGNAGPMRLYVGSLHFNITEDMLRGIFEPFGRIESIQLMMDSETGRSKGYGFITFSDAECAKKALEQLNGFELAGRPMKVGHVTERTDASTASSFLDSDELERTGIDLGTTGRLQLMARLAEGTGLQIPPAAQQALQMSGSIPFGAMAAVTAAVNPALSLGLNLNPSVTLPTQPIATQCFQLSNMFNPQAEDDPGWDVEIQDDVIEECNKHGGVVHIYVDKNSTQGNVYVKCPTIAAAMAAVNGLHGRWFAVRQESLKFVEEELENIQIPDMSGREGRFSYSIKEVKITELNITYSNLHFQPDFGIVFEVQNSSISLTFKRQILYWLFQDVGSINASAEGVNIHTALRLSKDKAGRLKISNIICDASISKMRAKFSGTMSKVYNILASFITTGMRFILNQQICPVLNHAGTVLLNSLLDTVPVKTQVDNYVGIDYSLLSNPVVTSENLDMDFMGMFYGLYDENDTLVNYSEEPKIREYKHMVYLSLSEYFFDSAMYSYFKAGVFSTEISREKMSKDLELLLRTTYFGTIMLLDPSVMDGAIGLELKVTSPPKCVIKPSGTTVSVTAVVNVLLLPDNQEPIQLSSMTMESKMNAKVSMKGKKLAVHMDLRRFLSLSQIHSFTLKRSAEGPQVTSDLHLCYQMRSRQILIKAGVQSLSLECK